MLTKKQVADVAWELSVRLRDAAKESTEVGQPPNIPPNKDRLVFDPADVETALKTALEAAGVEISEWMAGAAEPDLLMAATSGRKWPNAQGARSPGTRITL